MHLDKILNECFPEEMFNIILRKEKVGTEYYEVNDKLGSKTRASFFRYEDNPDDKKVHIEVNGVMDTCKITDLKDKIINVLNVALNIRNRFDDISPKKLK